jgi:hypothetical protein
LLAMYSQRSFLIGDVPVFSSLHYYLNHHQVYVWTQGVLAIAMGTLRELAPCWSQDLVRAR